MDGGGGGGRGPCGGKPIGVEELGIGEPCGDGMGIGKGKGRYIGYGGWG